MPMPKEQVFATLWARIAEKGDFPTLQSKVRDIVHAMQQEDATTAEMAEAVLADFALTQKVIRLANSPMYAPFGGDVSTVSQAIMVLGAETVGYLALGLQLIESFSGLVAGTAAAARELKQAQMAGEFARRCTAARGAKESETAVVCALMHPLARLLVVFYFPDEWKEIQALSEHWIPSESEACEQILGVSFADIAEEVADKWGLPATIASSMQPKPLSAEAPPETHIDWLGAVAQLASQAAAKYVNTEPAEEILLFTQEYAEALSIESDALRLGYQAMAKLKKQFDSAQAAFSQQERGQGESKTQDTRSRLEQGLTKVRAAAQRFAVTEIIPQVLETMMQALGYQHCFAFLLYPGQKKFVAKVGFGPGVREKLPQLSFDEGFQPDVFHLACTQKKTIFIEDAHERHIFHRLPAWYRTHFPDIRTFMLVPVQMRGRCIALLYGDWGGQAGRASPSDEDRNLVDLLAHEIALGFERQVHAVRTGG